MCMKQYDDLFCLTAEKEDNQTLRFRTGGGYPFVSVLTVYLVS